jgi:outer membrane lipoprotein-sorting protein
MKKTLLVTIIFCIIVDGFSQTGTQRRAERREQNKTFTQHGVDDPAAHAILNDVRRNLKSFRSLKIDFTLLTDNRNDRTANSTEKGTILIRGDRYNLSFMDLNMISDGKSVWSFNKETNEVHISTANPKDMEMLNPLAMIENYDKNFRAKLIREETENGVSVAIIDLLPFENRSYHKVRMVTNKANRTIVRSEVHEKSGMIMTFRIDRMQTNVSAPDSEFRFDASKHPGIEVVDMR